MGDRRGAYRILVERPEKRKPLVDTHSQMDK
jgi:hypothetical protein